MHDACIFHIERTLLLFVFYKYGSAYYHFALLLYFVLFSNLRILLQAAQDQTRGEHDVVARATSRRK